MNENKPSPSTSQTRANYDRLSRWYDLLAGIAEKKYKFAGLEMLDVQTGEHVLEIGFGTGQCLIPLAKAVGENGFVDAIDLSEGMRKVAEKKLIKAGLQEKVQLQVGDARELPYADERFDAVFMSFTLELFDMSDIPVVLQQIRRVLKRYGRLCMVAMAKRERTNLITQLYEWMHQRFPKTIDCRPIKLVPILVENAFHIQRIEQMSLFGLPVDVAMLVGDGVHLEEIT